MKIASRRLARLSLTLGFALFAASCGLVARAQDAVSMYGGNCGSLPNGKQWPTTPSGPPILKQRGPTDAHKDLSTASSFEAWRDFQSGGHAELYVCYADIRIAPSKGSGLHLLVTLPKELPKGNSVGDFVKQVDASGSEAKIYIKVPKKLHANVLLEVPAQTSFDVGLARGQVDFRGIRGDKDIGAGLATVSVHMLPDEYSKISAGFAFGGVVDERSGGRKHTGVAGGFEEDGKGKYKLEVGMAFGHLILLPEK